MYVQDLLEKDAREVFLQLMDDGHIYVCGDVTMAADVKKRLISIIQKCGDATEDEAKECLQILRVHIKDWMILYAFSTLRTSQHYISSN